MLLKSFCLCLGLGAVAALALAIDSQSAGTPTLAHENALSPSLPIYASGRVEGFSEETSLRFQLAGRVDQVLVREGTRVKAGDLLITLDSTAQRCQCAAVEAELAAARAELERLINGAREDERRAAAAETAALRARMSNITRRRDRVAALRERGASTQQELDDLSTEIDMLASQLEAAESRHKLLVLPAREDEVRRAEAKIAEIEARLELARYEYANTKLIAPIAGEVLDVEVRPGELAGPETPRPAAVLADTSRLFVRGFVEELDAPRLELGMQATATADGALAEEVSGKVVRLDPRMSQKRSRTDAPSERLDTKVREIWIELDEPRPRGFVIGLNVDVVLKPGAP